jgi:hypothetical protein
LPRSAKHPGFSQYGTVKSIVKKQKNIIFFERSYNIMRQKRCVSTKFSNNSACSCNLLMIDY